QLSKLKDSPLLKRTPVPPPEPTPWIVRPRRWTYPAAGALIVIPVLPPYTSMLASPAPALTMLIGFVMSRKPYSPGSSTAIVPPGAVFLWAATKLRHGVMRSQLLASSPIAAETYVSGNNVWADARFGHTPSIIVTSSKAVFVNGSVRLLCTCDSPRV